MEWIDVGDATLECVDEFCYLGDIIGVRGGAEASSIMRIRCDWKKFRELLLLLTMKGLSLHMKGSLYAACEKCDTVVVVVVLTPDSHAVVNQVDRRYLAFLPSPQHTILLLEDREIWRGSFATFIAVSTTS